MATVPMKVVDRARRLLPALGVAGAISRALSEHHHRYGHPADYTRTIIQMAAALGVQLGVELEPVTVDTLPPDIPYLDEDEDLRREQAVRASITLRLAMPTGTGHRATPTRWRRCTNPLCRHGAGTHMRRGRLVNDVSPSPCLWNDCPCEEYVAP